MTDTAESFAVRIKSNGARDTREGKREKNKKERDKRIIEGIRRKYL